MKIIKVINNNIITSCDDQNTEIILTGRGLGFGKKPGMPVDESKIEKTFHLDLEFGDQKLLNIIKDIPIEHIKAAGRIIEYAKGMMGDRLKDTIYLSLVDHINCAIERYQNDIVYSNPLLWEIAQYYPEEFTIGKQSLEILREEVGIPFSDDEAGFIAFHFITAEYDLKMSVTPDIPKAIHKTLDIINEYFPGEVQEGTIHFQRFLTHLKFFLSRLLQSEQLPDEGDFLFRSMIRKKYNRCYECVLEIKKYIEDEYLTVMSEEEVIYLTVHVKRITMKE